MYKVPKDKMKLQSLGVDADLFSPAKTEEEKKERRELRQSLNIQDDELVCIYTGRFSPGKNPQCLADAVHILQVKGERVRGLFLGNGTEREIEAIISKKGCIVHPFVGVRELPLFYRAADIGVWPQEESTSQLDAAACGLPLILSDHIQVKERIEGNGYLYEHANPNDLAEKILLLKDSVLREKFSKRGIEKVKKQFSWLKLAKDRLEDYRQYCPKN
jgi:glycosyltransferase involved in cell wall biosynthesis